MRELSTLVQALLLDNGYLTDLRTAAAGAVAARYLAREDGKPLFLLCTVTVRSWWGE